MPRIGLSAAAEELAGCDLEVLSGVEGIVLAPKGGLRLVISITLLQRSVLLEIDRDQVSTGGDFAFSEVAS